MRLCLITLLGVVFGALSSTALAQESSPMPAIPRAAPVDQTTTSTVMRTNSMHVLDDKKSSGLTTTSVSASSKIATTNRSAFALMITAN